MDNQFSFDVFLSHSSKDKEVVRAVAERLRADGLRVWFDEWEIKPGDSIPSKIEDGLERSRVLVLCMSANAFGSDWAQLESGTFRFRDPLNKDRRFIPLRLDDAPIKLSLAQFLYINWLPQDWEEEYAKLLEACRPPVKLVDIAAVKARHVTGQGLQRPESPRNLGKTKLPPISWQESLAVIQRQFEARAERSNGLHHLLVEVSDDERHRAVGPDWFVRLSPFNGTAATETPIGEPWRFVSSSGLPTVNPGFREVTAGETLDGIPVEKIVRDGSGVPRAVTVPMRLRFGYLCGDPTQLASFESLAKSASQVLTDEHDLHSHPLAEDMCDLFRKPRGGVRYVFGDVPSQPTQFMANGWAAGVLVFENGVLIDEPIAEDFPGVGHWLLLLHRLSWRKHRGCPLTGARLAWDGNMTVPYEWVSGSENLQQLSTEIQKTFAKVSGKSFYSVLGDRDCPLDVNLASVFALRLILSGMQQQEEAR
ncbi:MAG: toll/interleukin-1 receptor domain-containing protein [Candidatus Atribacteria bacterium]|nr:toll/interleukin-1 receptor domain-containing protein [Planctomycetota bacterium]MBE3119031.1 toll/interleukin-1 receptor domain-containing protein [Candidatus Atribacteria bacterium]